MKQRKLKTINKLFKKRNIRDVYLGRIEAVNRKRVGNQPRAGSVTPLIDQGVSGFGGGTWHIKMYDNYEEDIAAFKQKYPLIGNYTVEKMVLSQ